MSRIATPEDDWKLSASQDRALSSLLAGKTVTATANTVGVSRQTVHRWIREPDFQAALNAGRHDLRKEAETRLESIALLALDNVESAVLGGDTSMSLAILKGLGLLSGRSIDLGSESADEIRSNQRFAKTMSLLSDLGAPRLE